MTALIKNATGLTLLEEGHQHVGQRGLYCSQFATKVVRGVCPEALADIPQVPLDITEISDSGEKITRQIHYVTTAGFIYAFHHKLDFWDKLPAHVDQLMPGRVLCYCTPEDNPVENPTYRSPDAVHISFVHRAEGIRNFPDDPRFLLCDVSVLDSSLVDEQGVKRDTQVVSYNNNHVFIIEKTTGNIVGVSWKGDVDAKEWKPKKVFIGALKDNSATCLAKEIA